MDRSQVEEEMNALFDFMECVYGLFGFEFRLELSTRPDNYLGAIETWNAAEEVLISSPSLLLGLTRYPRHLATETGP
jgi:threonyl-tRNA synthetase